MIAEFPRVERSEVAEMKDRGVSGRLVRECKCSECVGNVVVEGLQALEWFDEENPVSWS